MDSTLFILILVLFRNERPLSAYTFLLKLNQSPNIPNARTFISAAVSISH
ncbi:hypothetical protein EW026_g2270 [Hermanssonia centrifuga]|uniref:Uncharacterized protein n=1 Tax=Hermanssonia centrifuga TaxID=98765 RepID=A0A4S4KNU0_9APHY|nr:hypothetical protein EW026_g2270 [Hermanssonia centrifuga]